MLKKNESQNEQERPAASKEQILKKSASAYEAVVVIAKEARRLNSAPEVFLEKEERPIGKALENFVEGKVEYEIEGDRAAEEKPRKRSRKAK